MRRFGSCGRRLGDHRRGCVVHRLRSLGVAGTGDARRRLRTDERLPHHRQLDAVLRSLRAGDAWADGREIELHHLVERRCRRAIDAEESLSLGVALHEIDEVAPVRRLEIAKRLRVDGEERGGCAVLGAHVGHGGAVLHGQRRETVAGKFDELVHDAVLTHRLGERQHEVGRRRSGRQGAGELHADDDRPREIRRLPEHRGLGLDAPDAPAEHAQPIDHRRVRVGAEERVGYGNAVADLHDPREPLEVHLVADARARRDDAERLEGLPRPAQQRITLAIALVLALEILLVDLLGTEEVGLHRMVDDQIDRDERFDARRVFARALHRAPHRREIHSGGNAGVILEQNARGTERDARAVGRGSGVLRERGDITIAVTRADHPLQQDLHGHRQLREVAELREREVAVRCACERLAVVCRHSSRSFTKSRSFSSSATVAASLAFAKSFRPTLFTIS